MARFRVRYVKAYTDRHGKPRLYFRRPGYPSVVLPGEPGTKAFAEAYQAAMDNSPRKIGEERAHPHSFSGLIAAYYESAGWGALAPITRATYRNVLERFRQNFGAMPVKAMTPKRLDELLDATTKNRETLRKVLRLILKLAVRREIIANNPLDGLRLPRKALVGFRAWEEADIALYEARWPSGSRERLALALLLYTAQRRDDARIMGRQHVSGKQIKVRQHKTGTELQIPIHPALKAELDAAPKDQLSFLQTQYGVPFSAAGFTKWFVEKAQEAGCPKGCTPHGLRKAACRRLAEAGCSPHEIMAVSGHKHLSEVTLYTEAANQQRLAADAMAKVEAGTKTSTQPEPGRQNGLKVQ